MNITKPEKRSQAYFNKMKYEKNYGREDEMFRKAYESAKRRCEIVMSRDNWEYELCQRLVKILERNYYGFPQWIYDQEEKELIMIKLNLR